MEKIFIYPTLSNVEASLSSFHLEKLLSINSVSSKSISSRILLLYFGVASRVVPSEHKQLKINKIIKERAKEQKKSQCFRQTLIRSMNVIAIQVQP